MRDENFAARPQVLCVFEVDEIRNASHGAVSEQRVRMAVQAERIHACVCDWQHAVANPAGSKMLPCHPLVSHACCLNPQWSNAALVGCARHAGSRLAPLISGSAFDG